jgi:predicted esterase
MLHGMTGDAEMMRPFASSICPQGWDLLVPEARFDHSRRGKTWWRYRGGDNDNRSNLSASELSDVDASLFDLAKIMPEGDLVIGGFSQGGALAQELLQFPFAKRIIGLLCIGTRCIRPQELTIALQSLETRSMLWMHGQRDHRVDIEDGQIIYDLFINAGWDITAITHKKGHMIPTEHHQQISQWLNSLL